MPNAILLAAGRGLRLRPLTDTIPKPLLLVGKHRLIEYHLFALAKASVKRVVINCSHLKEQFEPALGNGGRYGVEIIYSYEPQALETGGGIFKALPLLGPDPFLVVNADIFTSYDFSLLPEKLKGTAHLVLVPNPAHHPEGDFILSENRLIVTSYPPSPPTSLPQKLTYSGIGVFTPAFFKDCYAGCFPLAPLLHKAAKEKQVTGEIASCAWIDIGTKARLEEAIDFGIDCLVLDSVSAGTKKSQGMTE